MKYIDYLITIYNRIQKNEKVCGAHPQFVEKSLKRLFLISDAESLTDETRTEAKMILRCLEHFGVKLPAYIETVKSKNDKHLIVETFIGSTICSCKSEVCSYV